MQTNQYPQLRGPGWSRLMKTLGCPRAPPPDRRKVGKKEKSARKCYRESMGSEEMKASRQSSQRDEIASSLWLLRSHAVRAGKGEREGEGGGGGSPVLSAHLSAVPSPSLLSNPSTNLPAVSKWGAGFESEKRRLASIANGLPSLNEQDRLSRDHRHRAEGLRLIFQDGLLESCVAVGDLPRDLACRPTLGGREGREGNAKVSSASSLPPSPLHFLPLPSFLPSFSQFKPRYTQDPRRSLVGSLSEDGGR